MKYVIFAAILIIAACTKGYTDGQLNEIEQLISIIEEYKEITTAHEERAVELLSIIAAQQSYINHIESVCGQKI